VEDLAAVCGHGRRETRRSRGVSSDGRTGHHLHRWRERRAPSHCMPSSVHDHANFLHSAHVDGVRRPILTRRCGMLCVMTATEFRVVFLSTPGCDALGCGGVCGGGVEPVELDPASSATVVTAMAAVTPGTSPLLHGTHADRTGRWMSVVSPIGGRAGHGRRRPHVLGRHGTRAGAARLSGRARVISSGWIKVACRRAAAARSTTALLRHSPPGARGAAARRLTVPNAAPLPASWPAAAVGRPARAVLAFGVINPVGRFPPTPRNLRPRGLH